jgi:phosphoenolpyruvate-protein kinase (PTS system EI component)
MKKTIYYLAVSIVVTAGLVVTSCNSPAKKAEKAQENVEEAQQELQQQKAATAEEWNEFKSESEVKIKKNEIRIAEIKAKKMKPGQALDSLHQKRIDALEEKNNNLRTKINDYERNQSDWESFKREFNHDMNEIGKAFEDLTIDNKK